MATQIKLKKFCYINLVSKCNKIKVCFVTRIRRLRQGMFSVASVCSTRQPINRRPTKHDVLGDVEWGVVWLGGGRVSYPLVCWGEGQGRVKAAPVQYEMGPHVAIATFHFKQISNVLNFWLFATLDSGLRVQFRNAFRLWGITITINERGCSISTLLPVPRWRESLSSVITYYMIISPLTNDKNIFNTSDLPRQAKKETANVPYVISGQVERG